MQINVVLLLFFRVSQVLLDQSDLQGHQDYRYVISNYLLIPRELRSGSGVTSVLPDTQHSPSGLALGEDADGTAYGRRTAAFPVPIQAGAGSADTDWSDTNAFCVLANKSETELKWM